MKLYKDTLKFSDECDDETFNRVFVMELVLSCWTDQKTSSQLPRRPIKMQTNFGKHILSKKRAKFTQIQLVSWSKIEETTKSSWDWGSQNFAPQLGSIQAEFLCTCLITQQIYTSNRSQCLAVPGINADMGHHLSLIPRFLIILDGDTKHRRKTKPKSRALERRVCCRRARHSNRKFI